MTQKLVGLSIAFALLTLLFWVVEFLWPSIKGQKRVRKGFWTDVVYWFFTPLISKTASQVAVLIALVPALLMLGRSLNAEAIAAGYGPVLSLPPWLQAVLILVIGDFIGYWTHRWFHSRRLWAFHAVHHSSKELDWLSSVRLHPVNDIVSRVFQAVPFVLIGFSPVVIRRTFPSFTFYSIFIHANVSWNFGPFRHVIASPAFHRWHHTKEDEAIDMNFAGLLPVWDVIFGTFYLPNHKQPTEFGVHDDSVPESFLGQMMYPFRKRSRSS